MDNTFLPIEVLTVALVFSPRISINVDSRISIYKSIPTELINPDCSCPKRSPAPRIAKSRIAILNPLPNSVNSFIASKRFCASKVNIFLGSYIKYA